VDQEEVFVVIEGEATFETLDGTITVSNGEVVRFAPGEFHSGRNDSDRTLVAVAVGAPRDTSDVRLPVACPECDHGTLRLDGSGGGVRFVRPNCGSEHVPRDCPQCGGPALRVTLDAANRTVVACRDCGADFDRPPLRS